MSYVAHSLPPSERTLRKMLTAVFFSALLLIAGRAVADEQAVQKPAQEVPASAAVESHGQGEHKRTVLRFGDDDIHGDLTRPAGELVQAPRKPNQPSLLRVRKNFLDRALSGVGRGQ